MPELCAAVGRAQLKKLDAVNSWRTRNAEILRKELANLPGLRLPPAQRHSDESAQDVPHLFVALYDAAAMGAPRTAFVAALRAEGIPVGTGYVRPMYANPTFLHQVAFGSGGCPWTCRRDDFDPADRVRYEIGMCPVSERLLNEEFLWFYHIAYASTEADMHDIGRAVRKVVEHRSELTGLDENILIGLGGAGQGRIGTGPKAGTRS